MTPTLGSRLSRRDSERVVGRRAELAALESLFVDDPEANVAIVHGPGGIGKSTLLREIARRGERHGWRPKLIEGRELPPMPDALAGIFRELSSQERPLLLFDSFELIGVLAGYLRRELLPGLPELAIVVIATREPPDRGWSEAGWDPLTLELELGPLSESESAELLGARGITDERVTGELISWAEGSPLALALAADAAGPLDDWSPHRAVDRPRIVQTLIRRLAEGEIDPAYLSALDVAAVARVTTVELLDDVLEDLDGAEAFEWLAARSFTEPLGDGIAPHDLVRRAMDADLRRRDPDRERLLRRRIADHLHRRAVDRNLLLSIDLMHLVKDETIRWGYGWEGRARYRIDELGPGDAETIAARGLERGHEAVYAASRRFFQEAPSRIAVARDSEERLCGYQVSVTPGNAPAFADEHPLLGPWLEHARDRSLGSQSILWSESVDFTGAREARVQSMLGMAGVLRSGLENPRLAYMPIDPGLPGALEFCAALGARHIPELDGALGGLAIECHVIDYGPGGLLGFQLGFVYAELGLAPPPAPDRSAPIGEEEVRDALRNLRLPHLLAASPLAVGEGIDERAASVRRTMIEACERAFGDTADERLLHQVLVRGYLDPAPSQEAAADELHLSRSAYFRRLRAASERVAEYVARRPSG